MLDALKENFPASVTWNEPQGGMFIWVQLPPGIDSFKLLDQAIAQRASRKHASPEKPGCGRMLYDGLVRSGGNYFVRDTH